MLRLYCKNYSNADIAKLYHIVDSTLAKLEQSTELAKDFAKLLIFLQGVVEGRLENDSDKSDS